MEPVNKQAQYTGTSKKGLQKTINRPTQMLISYVEKSLKRACMT